MTITYQNPVTAKWHTEEMEPIPTIICRDCIGSELTLEYRGLRLQKLQVQCRFEFDKYGKWVAEKNVMIERAGECTQILAYSIDDEKFPVAKKDVYWILEEDIPEERFLIFLDDAKKYDEDLHWALEDNPLKLAEWLVEH